MVFLLNLGGNPLLPQDASGMGPTWLLREICIEELSNLVLTGEDGPAIECVLRPQTRGWRQRQRWTYAMANLLFSDGLQGSHEVVKRPGFGTQRFLLIVKDAVDTRAVVHTMHRWMRCGDCKACLFLEQKKALSK